MHSRGRGPRTGSALKHSGKGQTPVQVHLQVANEQGGDSGASPEGRPQARDGARHSTQPMLLLTGKDRPGLLGQGDKPR